MYSKPRIFPICLIAAVCSLPSLALTGCGTPAGVTAAGVLTSPAAQSALSAAANVIGSVATTELTSIVQKETTKSSQGNGNAAASALWSLADAAVTSGQAQSAITKATSGALTGTAQYVAAVLTHPTNNPAAVTSALATVISTASGAPPANPAQTIGTTLAATTSAQNGAPLGSMLDASFDWGRFNREHPGLPPGWWAAS